MLKELYIDGTKIEANANRYTFIQRGSINYHLAGLLDTIDALYAKYNAFLSANGYGPKYDLVKARMFVIDGMEKVRKVIEENRQLTKYKKIANNTIIEIDHCSPFEILKLRKNLMRIAEGEGILFVSGKGKHKPELQQLYEELEECGRRLMEYKECFEIMREDRNSYSKTDLGATFMRMKEDHMLNGQLKPAYNVQIAVENYFIVHSYVSNGRTDYNTLSPVLGKHQRAFGDTLEAVTADSGYCSKKNLLYLKENEDFRRFNYRSAKKVYKEFMLYAISRNIMKYHRFLHHEIEKYEGKKEPKAAQKKERFRKSKQRGAAP